MKNIIHFFSLFGSLSTLLCCALPVTLVSLGMGASFASLTATFPQVIWLAERKDELFIVTAILLAISYWLSKRAEKMTCPVDLNQKNACETSKKSTRYLFIVTIVIYLVGLCFAYVIPGLLYG